jgi:uncharacterized alkaline shock family protein YloU
VTDTSQPRFTPEVLTATVWDAIKDVPGVADLHRTPLQALGEKVRLERHGPVRLVEEPAGSALEVRIDVYTGATIPSVVEAVRAVLMPYLERTIGLVPDRLHLFVDDLIDRSTE